MLVSNHKYVPITCLTNSEVDKDFDESVSDLFQGNVVAKHQEKSIIVRAISPRKDTLWITTEYMLDSLSL